MRKRLLAIALAFVGMGGVLVIVPGSAGAASLEGAGWWWRGNGGVATSLVKVPPPPGVPEGGLLVQGEPEGPTAIAALRFSVTKGETDPVLTLAVASEFGGANAKINACPASSPWSPASGGDWNSKPVPGCGVATVAGQRAADGKTFTWDVAGMIRDEVVDVVLVPAPASTFSVTFTKPTPESLKSSGGAGDTFTSEFDSGSALEAGDLEAGGSFDPDSSLLASGSLDSSFSAPLSSDIPAVGGTLAVPERELSAPAANRVLPVPASGRGKGIALLLALGALGAAFFVSQQQTPPLRMLGSFAEGRRPSTTTPSEPQLGGLGRFAKLRKGPPPSL